VERVVSSPFLLGRGRVRMAHGTWPVPAPAVLALIEGYPSRVTDLEGETVTPTGAALVVTLAHAVGGEWPMTLTRTAQGAGSREWPDRPNVLRGFLGESDATTGVEEVEVLETSIDDMTPEAAAWLANRLLESGVLDVITHSILMKKGRPGFHITVLTRPGEAHGAAMILFREATTLGVRYRRERRWVLERRVMTVTSEWGPVAVKVAEIPEGGGVRVSPEFEDCAAVARAHRIPLIQVMDRVRELARDLIVSGGHKQAPDQPGDM
jgi:uncharacterized protein (DUF111 family)